MKPKPGSWVRILGSLIGLGLCLCLPEIAIARPVTLVWDRNTEPDLAGYKVHIGTWTGEYTQTFDVGHMTVFTVTDVSPGDYYFAVTAYDIFANESGFSNEVTITIPEPPVTPVSTTTPISDIVSGEINTPREGEGSPVNDPSMVSAEGGGNIGARISDSRPPPAAHESSSQETITSRLGAEDTPGASGPVTDADSGGAGGGETNTTEKNGDSSLNDIPMVRTENAGSAEKTKGTGSAERSESTESIERAERTGSTESTGSTETSRSMESTESAGSTASTEGAERTERIEGTKSTQVTKSTETSKSAGAESSPDQAITSSEEGGGSKEVIATASDGARESDGSSSNDATLSEENQNRPRRWRYTRTWFFCNYFRIWCPED